MLLERHGALPAAVECGLLLAAHACYEAASRADALGVLVQLAGRAMQQWAQRGDWRPLVQLTAGGCSRQGSLHRPAPCQTILHGGPLLALYACCGRARRTDAFEVLVRLAGNAIKQWVRAGTDSGPCFPVTGRSCLVY